MPKRLGMFLIALLFTGVLGGSVVLAENELHMQSEQVATQGDLFAQDEILVQFKGIDHPIRIKTIGRGKAIIERTLAQFKNRVDVVYAEPNYIAEALYIPNDPYYGYQWHLDNAVNGGIGMEEAWDINKGSGVTVAVVDTGVAYENYTQSFTKKYYQAPDLAQTSFAQGYDFVNNDTHPNDDNGHGTHVAGTIAESTGNGVGVAGVAPQATIMPVKVLNSSGSGTYADIADGIRYAADHGAKVISMSLGGSSGSQTLEDALAYAYQKGVTIVAAAGNDGHGSVSYPAAYDQYVIAVGATRFDETLAPYSNYGSSLDIVAPGGDTSVDQNGDGYGDGVLQQTFSGQTNNFGYYFFQGTSMATPHVAGVAALVLSHGNAITPLEVRSALEESADDLGALGRDDTYGYGLLNAYQALLWSDNGGGSPPPPPANEPPHADAGNNQSVYVNDSVLFDGSGSSDSDGTVVSYAWDFGNGNSTTTTVSSGVGTNYSTVGVYTVTLTVTDDDGATDTDTATVTVSDVVAGPTLHVSNIVMSGTHRKSGVCRAQSTIYVQDESDSNVSRVTVNGSWSGAYSGSASGYTSNNNRITFTSPYVACGSAFTFTVDSLDKSGYTYDVGQNIETSDSITP